MIRQAGVDPGLVLELMIGGESRTVSVDYFWIILSRAYTALAAFDELLIEYPQGREHENPQLRQRNEQVRVAWDELTRPWLENPSQAAEGAKRIAGRKFSEAADIFYGETGSEE